MQETSCVIRIVMRDLIGQLFPVQEWEIYFALIVVSVLV